MLMLGQQQENYFPYFLFSFRGQHFWALFFKEDPPNKLFFFMYSASPIMVEQVKWNKPKVQSCFIYNETFSEAMKGEYCHDCFKLMFAIISSHQSARTGCWEFRWVVGLCIPLHQLRPLQRLLHKDGLVFFNSVTQQIEPLRCFKLLAELFQSTTVQDSGELKTWLWATFSSYFPQ